MRIDAFNRVSQLYQANSTKKTLNTGKKGNPDRVEISQMGQDVQAARAAVAKAPDIREDRVAAIRERMDAGTYTLDMDALADKLLTGYIF
ncbi:MAG: flagellar biosynthesis anti-sigma factor FlgM [Lachnospiraceae bacterium]|nr:flagellar biosynthesis anti-sigma factor FlgM [Lachnospiraceae bacterium]